MDPANERYYRVLNLEPTATTEQVYRAYRDLCRVWDPQRFAMQPHLELMAEAKLKEIIEAYNALTAGAGPGVTAAPAPPEPPELLTPVPEHIADRNAPAPVFPIDTVIPAPPGELPPEPEVPRPLQPWEVHRPASYPKPPEPAPPPFSPDMQYIPEPPPPYRNIWKLAAQFSVFVIPVALAAVGLIVYNSAPNRAQRQQELPSQAPQTPTPAPAVPHESKKIPLPIPQAELEPTVLPTGTELMTPRAKNGAGRFRVANRSGQDAVVRVCSQATPGTPLRLVYVQAGTEVPIGGISTGMYVVYVSLGPLTAAPRKFGAPLGPFQFMQIDSVDGPQSDDYEIVLKPAQ
jgi:hypothetical protein